MRAIAPGRVNLIGDHTDYTGGLVFPMAIDRYTTITFERSDSVIDLHSEDDPVPVTYSVTEAFDPGMHPRWGRYVAAVTSLISSPQAIRGTVSTTIPVGAGLSSSAALEIAVALACGAPTDARELSLLTQHAEHLATGVPTGIMDQLCITSAREGHGTLIDCRTFEVQHVPIPEDLEFVVRFITHRTLEGSEYSSRVAQCTAAEREIGALRDATLDSCATLSDPVVRHRAQHVVQENQRVTMFARALQSHNFEEAGQLMTDSHQSLAELFEISTPQMDAAVAEILSIPGVYGARMTGGGFGGCVVAMVKPGTQIEGWRVRPVSGARLLLDE